MLKQAPAGTYTAAALAGTYILAAASDNVLITIPPIVPCTPGSEAVAGSTSCGTGIHPENGATYGELTLTASGAITYSFTDVNDLGVVTSTSGSGTFTVEPQCFGLDSSTPADPNDRLAFTDSACSGGQNLDMVIIHDPDTGSSPAKFFIGDGGDVLTFFDPQSIAPIAGQAGKSRSLGNAARLR